MDSGLFSKRRLGSFLEFELTDLRGSHAGKVRWLDHDGDYQERRDVTLRPALIAWVAAPLMRLDREGWLIGELGPYLIRLCRVETRWPLTLWFREKDGPSEMPKTR